MVAIDLMVLEMPGSLVMVTIETSGYWQCQDHCTSAKASCRCECVQPKMMWGFSK